MNCPSINVRSYPLALLLLLLCGLHWAFAARLVKAQETKVNGRPNSVQFSGLSLGALTIRASRQGYEPGEVQIDLRNSDRTLQSVEIALMPRKYEGSGAPKALLPPVF